MAQPHVVIDSLLTEVGRGIMEAMPKDMSSQEFEALIANSDDPGVFEGLLQRYQVSETDLHEVIALYREKQREFLEYLKATGMTEDALLKQVKADWKQDPLRATVPGGESILDGRVRAAKVREQRLDSLSFQCCLVVSHGLFGNIFILDALNVELSQFKTLKQGNGCINILWKPNGSNQYELLVLNDLSHAIGDSE